MKTYTIVALFCTALFLVLQIGCAVTSSQSPLRAEAPLAPEIEIRKNTKERIGQQTSNQPQISKEEAIAIAEEDAAKNYQSLEPFKVVGCERARLWVVIYDSGGPEYYIDKNSGAILSVWKWPRDLKTSAEYSESSSNKGISKTEAIEIAKKHFTDFLVSYGDAKEHVNEYDAVACELANAWRVFFEYRAAPGQSLATLPNSNPPNYIIDKGTGRIIYTTHQITP